MTYKNSLGGINFGGGKSVIIKDSSLAEGRDRLFESFGKKVQSLGGKYITAEDMGTSVADMSLIQRSCEFVAGRDPNQGGGGDPSPYTAIGVFEGMKACLERTKGSADFAGVHVTVQGVGHVGIYLCELLAKAGATLTVSDTVQSRVDDACQRFGAKAVGLEEILTVPCDIFAPCAVGEIITEVTAEKLQCRIVAGAANNQVTNSEAERVLARRGIEYAPDFAINAGGVILCADEFEQGGFTESRVLHRVSNIYHTVGKVLDEAKKTGALPNDVATRLARERIERAKNARG
jgi:leucine dehydrogenase